MNMNCTSEDSVCIAVNLLYYEALCIGRQAVSLLHKVLHLCALMVVISLCNSHQRASVLQMPAKPAILKYMHY